jgi:DNA-binding transcriptional regulator YiaG
MTGKQLQALRRKAGLSQVEMSKMVPVKLKTLQNWEQSRRAIGSIIERWLRHSISCYQERVLRDSKLDKPST